MLQFVDAHTPKRLLLWLGRCRDGLLSFRVFRKVSASAYHLDGWFRVF